MNLEFKICTALNWNFEHMQTPCLWASWFMQRWDDYVDSNLSYLGEQNNLKFFQSGQSQSKFFSTMSFVDIVFLSYASKNFKPRILIASIMYIMIGSREILGAFEMDFKEMTHMISKDYLPILTGEAGEDQKLPTGVLFYN